MEITWSGIICYEGRPTGDGRLIEANSLRWEDLPLTLGDAPADSGGHDGALTVGHILTIERRDDGAIFATGTFDVESPAGYEAARQVYKGLRSGVSVDLDDVSFEVRVKAELLDEMDAAMEEVLDENGEYVTPEREVGEDGRVVVSKHASDDELWAITDAKVRAATLVRIQAVNGAKITLDDPAAFEALTAPDSATLVASASDAESLPPINWFTDPGLTEVTPITVTPEGRVFGHIADWETCHTAFPGECVTAPRSATNYAYFRTGAVLTDDGEVAVGTLTMDTLHAGKSLRANSATRHYENTGMAAAFVSAGEDAHGIWVAGVIAPGLSAADVRRFRASPISGDWRRIGGNLELVAALAVNVPGFPIPRPAGLVASGHVQSLVASGMVAPRKVLPPGTEGALSADDLRYLKRLAKKAAADEKKLHEHARQLGARVAAVRAKELADRVRDTLATQPVPTMKED